MLFKARNACNAHIKPRWIDLGLFEMKKPLMLYMSGTFNSPLYVHLLSSLLILKVSQPQSFEQRKSILNHGMDRLKANVVTEPPIARLI